MNCIILGDKYQQGMKSKGCAALIEIKNKSNILLNQYATLKSIFNEKINITYVYGFDNKKFLDFIENSKIKISIEFNDKFNIYNQAFSLSLVKNIDYNDDLMIIDGYQKLNKNMFKKFDQIAGSKIFMKDSKNCNNNSVGCTINNGKIEHLSFDLDNSIHDMYYLDKEFVGNLFAILEQTKYHNNFIFELINKLIDNGLAIKAIN